MTTHLTFGWGTLRSMRRGLSIGDATLLLALGGEDQLHEFLHEGGVVVPGPGGDEVAVDDGAVDVLGPALFGIERALGDGGDGPAADDTRRADDLDAVADDGHRLVGFEEVSGDPQQLLVIPEIFGCAAAG